MMLKPELEVIKLSGVINSATSQDLRQSLNQLIEKGVKTILVDFQDVTFMDSSGLGALVLAFKTLRASDSKLVICSLNEQVRILFELTSMDQVFEIFHSQDEFHQTVLSKN
ncbi:MAG: STAS domain-containing protein [Aulosira sp. DedQUE10]|nr:STAS domain-containing protein [Aulosira sp. DedQUE10]